MIAAKYGITREEQDAFAVESHRRAAGATKEGYFREEILPVEIPGGRGAEAYELVTDEAIRPESSMEALAKLKAAFQEGWNSDGGETLRR